ncbi:hypothetical protein A2Y85_00920 [candidate division WOR-3 bacterium RBG_13_43_14]|uniref:NTP pyrophosphohydrolase MazG-like domain-containing protein n=1 Tax=candidate division WOR-3 bacterium RBG_13_43_14 TaxID=1802590 RepID=A0A1F4UB67_UNCW3|nr:MAG: hypothetical protein A2Y85_00920 [candidate division WOR-3 bacterium RBG_13_43_14]
MKKKKHRSIKKSNKNSKLDDLLVLVRTLRRKCPWDRIQTLKSFKSNAIEEAYEFVEAVEGNEKDKLAEEVGDLLFVAIFGALICEQERGIRIKSMIAATIKKYQEKHPHVFKRKDLKSAEAVLEFWQRSKKDIFKGIPRSLPSMHAARLIQERAAKLGFDWPEKSGPMNKINEELSELRTTTAKNRTFEEFGDLLFACVNYARHIKIDPERALHKANQKFIKRFRSVITELQKQGKEPHKVSLEEMDRLWDEIKKPGKPKR